LPLALALAVNAAMPLAFAGDAIHIRAQPLGQALSELGQQTSLQVFFSPDLVAGKQAPAVDGNVAGTGPAPIATGQRPGISDR
jgi:Fe(3+) dicitrate transport protein